MAKPSSKPAQKGQSKAKTVPASKAKPVAKVTVKAGKAAASKGKAATKTLPLKATKPAKSAAKAVATKPVKPTAKVAKPVLKSAGKVIAKATKPAPKAVSKPTSKQAAKPVKLEKKAVSKIKVTAKSPGKVVAKAKAPATKKSAKPVAKVAAKAVPAKAKTKALLEKKAAAPLVVKGKKEPKGNKATEAPKPAAVVETPGNQKKVVHASSKALARTLAQLPPPPPPPPMLPEPQRHVISPAALKAFEHAVKVFNRQHYEDAKKLFESLEEKFPLDGEVIGRAQIYLQACSKKMAAEPAARPVSADDLYDQGVHALNNGDYVQARQYFEKALKLNPNEPDFLYSLAAVHAQTGAPDQALDLLARSIEIKPRFRSQAFEDSDFSELRGNRQFMELLGLTSPFERLEQRR